MLKLYNTLTRKKEIFKPIKNEVGIYSCGPTVYWFQHIGNLRSYIFADILKKVLIYNDYKVRQVINITDVGHLTSDEDEGEDKIEKAAAKEHKTAKEIADFYFNKFHEDLEKLNISEPEIWCKASEHIKEQIELVKELENKGYTYQTSDGIYFDTSKFKDYGKLAKLKKEGLEAGKRVSLGEKKNKTDFALWKFSSESGKRQQEWESPWGIGFPGWHIECSAMSSKYLGKQFDIHTGGEDHIPVHHTNEIAQSECAFDVKPWVRFWLHGSFLKFEGEKMSKSKGKIATLSELEEQGFSAMDYRYFILTAHYRKQLNFTKENLENAKNSYERLKRIISSLQENNENGKSNIDKVKDLKDSQKSGSKEINAIKESKVNNEDINKKYLEDFEKAINNDLDMPNALKVLWKLVRDEKAKEKINTIKEMDKVFSLDLLKQEKIQIPDEIKELADKREKARKDKDWKLADELRDKIKEKGYSIADSNECYKIDKV